MFLVLTSAAFAARPYLSQLTEADGSPFAIPFGLEVDSGDNLWVSDTGTSLVSKFDSSGAFLAQNDGVGSWEGSPYIQDVAYGETADKIYVADSNFDNLWVLNSNATYAGTSIGGIGDGCCVIYAAVDNTGRTDDGDIYVSSHFGDVTRIDGTGAASNFSASAPYITDNRLTGTPGHTFGFLSGVAVGANGDVYVVDQTNAEVDQFDSTGTFVRAFRGTFGTLSGVAIDPTNGNVLISDERAVHEFDSTGAFVADIDGSTTPDSSFAPNGLAVDSAGNVYVADGAHAVVDVFGADVPQHTVDVTKTGAGRGTVTSSPVGIACGATCSAPFNENSTVRLTATPDSGSELTGWTVDGRTSTCPGTGVCELAIGTTDHTVEANFEPVPQHTLDVTKAGAGTGTVTSTPGGISCGVDCTELYNEGQTVTLAATPGSHGTFGGWNVTGDPGTTCVGTTNPCRVTMDADVDVTATFAVDTHALTVSKNGTGSGTVTGAGIDCGSDCSEVDDHGTVITLTATPVSGSTFTGWSGGGCSGAGTCQVTLTAAAAVTATFTLIPPPPDTDRDGVPDSSDGCPTVAGPVSNNGCPVRQPPTDSDGDGVPDSTDACPLVDGPASNNGCPPVVPDPGKLIAAGTATVKAGKASLKLTCKGDTACSGRLRLTAKVKVRKGKKMVKKTVTLGSATVNVDADSSKTVTIRLNRRARGLLAAKGRLKATLTGPDLKRAVLLKNSAKKK